MPKQYLSCCIRTQAFSLLLVACFSHTTYAQLDRVEAYYQQQEKRAKKEKVTLRFINEEMELVDDFSKLKQIVLLRHGEPAIDKRGWRKRKDAIKFIRAYDSVGVYAPDYLPLLLDDKEVDIVFTSTLNRSMSTAEQVFGKASNRAADSLYKEFERKIFAFPNIKLPLNWWLTGSRMLWLMGLNKKDIESFKEAKSRAKQAANVLDANASENSKTLLVSHGFLNHFLVKYLRENGWTEVFDGGKGYLSQKVLVKYEK